MEESTIIFKDETMETDIPRSKPVPYPWRRFFARYIDNAIYSLILSFVIYLVLRVNPGQGLGRTFLLLVFGMIITLVLEPLMLSTIGTTPGKWIYGLKIRAFSGEKLTFKEGFDRTFGVIKYGKGFEIPFYSLYRTYKSYVACGSGEKAPWELDYDYTIKDQKNSRIIGAVAAIIILFSLSISVGLIARLPVNRGPLTQAEYIENVNYIMNVTGIDIGKAMNDNGQWEEIKEEGVISIDVFPTATPDHQLIISDGVVKGIKIESDQTNDHIVRSPNLQKYIIYMAFAGAHKENNFMNVTDDFLEDYLADGLNSFTYIYNGIEITQEVDYDGYVTVSDDTLFPREGDKQSYHMTFSVRLVE